MEQPRGDNGQFISVEKISVEKFIMAIIDERFSAIRREDVLNQKALDLQAAEYERRLTDLNHAHKRAQDVQHTFLSIDKYEGETKAADMARELALKRIDEKVEALDKDFTEKLEAYITKTDLWQKDVELKIAEGKGAAEEAKRATVEAARKMNRNMTIGGLILAVIVAVAQWLGTGATP